MLKLLQLICIVTAINQVISASDICQSPVPGVDRLIRGVDITKLDLFPEDLAQSNGFQRSIVSLSCSKGRKWKHPFDASLVFDIPDQIDTINTLPGGVLNTKTTLIETVEDYKKSMSVDMGLEVNTIQYGAYSASGSYKKAQENLINTTKSMVQVSAYVSAIRVDLNPYYELKADDYFQEFVEKLLPDKYSSNPQKYQEFVDTFGTHYFENGFFGGFLQQTIEMNSNLNLKLSEQEIEVNAGASFLTVLKLKGGYKGETKNVSLEFSQNSQIYTSYYGGKSNLMKENGWADWWESVPKDPWLFGGKLKPIANLVNGPKKDQVTEAVRIKLDKAFMEDMKRTLVLFSRYASVSVQNQISEIEKLLTQTIPSHSDVLSLKQSIDSFLVKEMSKLDKIFLNYLENALTSVQNSELFCKQIVAEKCMPDHLKDVQQTIDDSKNLWNRADDLKKRDIPERLQFKELSRIIEKFLYRQKTEKLDECKEKLFCNLCKIFEVILKHRSQCDTTSIKNLLNIHV